MELRVDAGGGGACKVGGEGERERKSEEDVRELEVQNGKRNRQIHCIEKNREKKKQDMKIKRKEKAMKERACEKKRDREMRKKKQGKRKDRMST